MARKSIAHLSVVAGKPGSARLAPPAGLSDYERALWFATVNGKPAEWFGPEHGPLLAQWCRHAASAELLAQQVAAFDPAWVADDAGLRRFDRLLAMREREGRAASSLATRMRLTQQSVYRADKAATLASKATQRKPWQEGAK